MLKELFKRLWRLIMIQRTGYEGQFEFISKLIIEDFNNRELVDRYIVAHLSFYPLNIFKINKLIKKLEDEQNRSKTRI